MRKIRFCIILFFFGLLAYAGDIAIFESLGFSPDGSKFVFAEHGLTDETYRAYAEIYGVDVARNAFLRNGIFKTRPSSETAGKDSNTVFLEVLDRANYALKKWNIQSKNKGRPLFVLTNATINDNTLIFRDFETNDEYVVVLHKNKHSGLAASFYIIVEIIKPNGSKIVKEVGNRNTTRSGVKDYAIKKVLIDDTNTSLVFVIEKHVYNKTGNSIRYMVETLKL